MSLDEETNNQNENTLSAPLNGRNGEHAGISDTPDTIHTADGTDTTVKSVALTPLRRRNVTTPIPPVARDVATSEAEIYAQRRARLNRLLIRKRRYVRTNKNW